MARQDTCGARDASGVEWPDKETVAYQEKTLIVSRQTFGSYFAPGGRAPLEHALARHMAGRDRGEGHVVLANEKDVVRVSTPSQNPTTGDLWVDVGCLSKLVTATTFLRICGDSREVLNAPLSESLDVPTTHWASQVTTRQLLGHTHGLDEPGGWKLPVRADGTIDVNAVLHGVGDRPIAAAGEHYSYAAVGYWLLAAILEKRTGKRFLELVIEHFGTAVEPGAEGRSFCPAYGGSVRLSAEQLLLHLVQATSMESGVGRRCVRLGAGLVNPHPGWHPTEKGVCMGWKVYGRGWYGHKTGLVGAAHIIAQVSPTDGLGVLVCSSDINPWKFIACSVSPDIIEPPGAPRAPATMGGMRLRAGNAAGIEGVYDRLDSRIEVLRIDGGLAIKATSKVAGDRQGVMHASVLQPVFADLYAVIPAVPFLNLYVVEFIRDRQGAVSHLWNTARLWHKDS